MRTTSQVLAWARNSMTDRPERKLRSLVIVLTLLGMFAFLAPHTPQTATWAVRRQAETFQTGANWNIHRVPFHQRPATGNSLTRSMAQSLIRQARRCWQVRFSLVPT